MPAALYAISFKSTLGVLGVTSLEKQVLADAAARDSFLHRLVGDKLRISMVTKTSGQLVIDASELAADEIDVADQAPLITDPYAYKLTGQSPTDTITAGDGTPKKVSRAGNAADVTLTSAGLLTVTLHNAPSEKITIGLVFEGQPLVTNTLTSPATVVQFSVGPLIGSEYYAVVVIAKDVPTTALRVKAA